MIVRQFVIHSGLSVAVTVALALTAVLWGPRAAADNPLESGSPRAVQDAWIDGRVESALELNQALGAYEIDVQVNEAEVRLSGVVQNDIDRELAEEIAAAVQGVQSVDNALTVDSGAAPAVIDPTDRERTFGQRVSDATASAKVKRELGSNGKTKALGIDVATENDVVTLTGRVPSRTDKMLAEMIARNTDGIDNVRNQLEIVEQS